jgi:hypothetical protein
MTRQKKKMSREELVAMFAAMATAPPPEANKLLARHLQCKSSVRLAAAVREAVEKYPGSDPLSLPAPSTLLPPLL